MGATLEVSGVLDGLKNAFMTMHYTILTVKSKWADCWSTKWEIAAGAFGVGATFLATLAAFDIDNDYYAKNKLDCAVPILGVEHELVNVITFGLSGAYKVLFEFYNFIEYFWGDEKGQHKHTMTFEARV